MKLRHLLQYLNTTQTLGLLYPYPRDREMTSFTVYSDASFAPSGKHSQSGYTIHLSFGYTKHLIHWQSVRERVRSLRALPRQNFTPWQQPENLLATFGFSFTNPLLPPWRTRYISIYGEAIRQEMLEDMLTLTHISTEFQLADPLTKPTSSSINSMIFPQWGLVSFTPSC